MVAKLVGPFFIAVAAILWASDSVFRFPTVSSLNPALIVFLEHLLAVLVLFPWIRLRHGKDYTRLSIAEWLAAFTIGAGGSAIATILFTASFQYINPSVTILLQKLQPVMVVVIAYLVLGEHPPARFFFWAALAILAGIGLSFPDLNFSFLSGAFDIRSIGVLYAFTAAALWAVATILGKILLRRTPSSIATFWRYVFGLATAGALVGSAQISIPWETLGTKPIWGALLYMSLVPGLTAMLAYYAGLARTPATVTTFVELIFPVSAVVLNTVYLNTPLSTVQIVAAAVLLVSILKISLDLSGPK